MAKEQHNTQHKSQMNCISIVCYNTFFAKPKVPHLYFCVFAVVVWTDWLLIYGLHHTHGLKGPDFVFAWLCCVVENFPRTFLGAHRIINSKWGVVPNRTHKQKGSQSLSRRSQKTWTRCVYFMSSESWKGWLNNLLVLDCNLFRVGPRIVGLVLWLGGEAMELIRDYEGTIFGWGYKLETKLGFDKTVNVYTRYP